MKQQTERWIAISVILGSIFIIIALGLVMGRFSVSSGESALLVNFPSVTGIAVNSPVKYAGAPVGRVKNIRILSREEQTMREKSYSFVQIALDLNQPLQLTQELQVAVKQDGFMGSKYIALIPGRPDGAPLEKGTILEGQDIIELTELGPDFRMLISEIQPTLQRLDSISSIIESALPNLIQNMDNLVENSNQVISVMNTPEGKEELKKVLSNMKVISDNLKVVSTYTKGFTKTIAEKPWKMIWGGTPNQLPSEEEIMKSKNALPINRSKSETKD